MIPKVIHYCWFGKGALPELALKCIESWKKYCPDYEIREWNESNFDIAAHPFTKVAYAERKYSFVADYIRFNVIYEHGGIYLDTDVELIRSIDPLLQHEAFVGTENFGALINPGSGFGASKHSKIIGEFFDFYKGQKFENEDGSLNMTPITCHITPILAAKGWRPDNGTQTIEGLTIYPTDYFCPKDYDGIMRITKNTYSIHHFSASWVDENMRSDSAAQQKVSKIIGSKATVYVWYLLKIYRRKGAMHIIRKAPALLKKFRSRNSKK